MQVAVDSLEHKGYALTILGIEFLPLVEVDYAGHEICMSGVLKGLGLIKYSTGFLVHVELHHRQSNTMMER